MAEDARVKALIDRIIQTPGLFELLYKILNDEAVSVTLQPRLEFLASVPNGESTEDSILRFFDQLNLSALPWEHDGSEYRVIGDTYLLEIKILPPSNSDTPKAEILLIIVEAVDFLELENLRDMILENQKNFPNLFRDFILVWDANGVIRSWLSYISLHVLENQLRKLIISRLMGVEDDDWWNKRIKNPAGQNYSEHKNKEARSRDITHHTDEVLSDIFYTNFSDLKNVISEPNNWNEVFKHIFMTEKYITKLWILNTLRNKIAHNRFLTERNQKDLIDWLSAMMRVFRKVWGR
ncbi:hypothetical protein LC607_28880 [Nostoc sp. CHAB 5824]|nr:hypothetical protein [Nostoc sp. CHAB 5824]